MAESRYITDILRTIKRFFWLIALLIIIGGVAGKLLASAEPTHTYQAFSLVLLEEKQKNKNVIINQSDENVRFLNTAQTLVKTPIILDSVIKDLKLDDSTIDLGKKITAANENGSQVMRITVEENDPEKATAIVNKIIEIYEIKAKDYLDIDTLHILESAQPGLELQIQHSRPNASIVMGIIIGGVIGTLLAFILDYFFKKRRV
jgi:capsular polysaccharide biosynthesis protein